MSVNNKVANNTVDISPTIRYVLVIETGHQRTERNMDDARMTDMLQDLREGGGMLSRGELIDMGYLETEIQAAAKQDKIAVSKGGAFASIFLCVD